MTGTVAYLARLGDLLVLERAGHDAVAHAREHAGDVLHRLARAQADFLLPQAAWPVPPRCVIATAKLTRVRRLGFSKIIASVLPARIGSLRPVS